MLNAQCSDKDTFVCFVKNYAMIRVECDGNLVADIVFTHFFHDIKLWRRNFDWDLVVAIPVVSFIIF